jgi:hypothetical protein
VVSSLSLDGRNKSQPMWTKIPYQLTWY